MGRLLADQLDHLIRFEHRPVTRRTPRSSAPGRGAGGRTGGTSDPQGWATGTTGDRTTG